VGPKVTSETYFRVKRVRTLAGEKKERRAHHPPRPEESNAPGSDQVLGNSIPKQNQGGLNHRLAPEGSLGKEKGTQKSRDTSFAEGPKRRPPLGGEKGKCGRSICSPGSQRAKEKKLGKKISFRLKQSIRRCVSRQNIRIVKRGGPGGKAAASRSSFDERFALVCLTSRRSNKQNTRKKDIAQLQYKPGGKKKAAVRKKKGKKGG